MTLDGQTISTILIAVSGLLIWANTQVQARSKSQRAELKHRRILGLESGRYTYDCEQALMKHGIDLPEKRDALTDVESEEW